MSYSGNGHLWLLLAVVIRIHDLALHSNRCKIGESEDIIKGWLKMFPVKYEYKYDGNWFCEVKSHSRQYYYHVYYM